jgi:hypothetical protein
MGSDESLVHATQNRAFDPFMYAPISSHRNEATYAFSYRPTHAHRKDVALLRVAYHGIWSMVFPKTIAPVSRLGQCHVYDPPTNCVFIAYGVDAGGRPMNDFWCLNIHTRTWRMISRALLPPRAYASACLIDGRRMFVFGGASGSDYRGDPHAIDLDSGSVTRIGVQGDGPPGCTSPMLVPSGGFIYVWGGFNGTAQSTLFRIPVGGGVWERIGDPRAAAAPVPCLHGSLWYVYEGGLSLFEPDSGHIHSVPCIGTEPASDLSRPALVSADEYLFLVGGEASSQFMHLFALDVRRYWSYAFHVRPDNDTLSTDDGSVSAIGLFMMPREHAAAVVYSQKTRELISIMGSRMHEPPPIFRIAIGEALGVIHLRSDMLEAYAATCRS